QRVRDRKLEPFAAAVLVELRGVQLAVVERALSLRAKRLPILIGNELVDVLVAFVIAHITDDTAASADRQSAALVPEAAERGTLHGRRGWVHRVDLDDPAEAIALVREIRVPEVEARIELAPAVEERPERGEPIASLQLGRHERGGRIAE